MKNIHEVTRNGRQYWKVHVQRSGKVVSTWRRTLAEAQALRDQLLRELGPDTRGRHRAKSKTTKPKNTAPRRDNMRYVCSCKQGEDDSKQYRAVNLNADASLVYMSLECLLCGQWTHLTGHSPSLDLNRVKAYKAEKVIQRWTLCHCHLGKVKLVNVHATGRGHELVGDCLGERCPEYAAATNYPVMTTISKGFTSTIKLPDRLTASPRPRNHRKAGTTPADFLDDNSGPEYLDD